MKVLQDLQPPTSLYQLRHFLGLLNYYRRFIPYCADLLSPLSDLLRNKKKKNEQISLNDIQLKVFNEVKQKLVTTSLLAHPVPDAQFSLVVDASGTAVGAVLQQQHQQQLKPLAYFSRDLKPTEQRYSTFGRELLAMYLAVKHFQHSLEGRQFVILLSHCVLSRKSILLAKPATWILFRSLPTISDISLVNRMLRQTPYLAFPLILCSHLQISTYGRWS